MGHKRTIRPNAKRLSALFSARHKMDWDTFARKVRSCQRGFMGEPEESRPGRGEFHEFPSPCICKKPPFMYSGTNKTNDMEQNFETVGNVSEVRSKNEHLDDDLRDRNPDELQKASIALPETVREEIDHDGLLAD